MVGFIDQFQQNQGQSVGFIAMVILIAREIVEITWYCQGLDSVVVKASQVRSFGAPDPRP